MNRYCLFLVGLCLVCEVGGAGFGGLVWLVWVSALAVCLFGQFAVVRWLISISANRLLGICALAQKQRLA